ARVIATGSADHVAYLRSLGADQPVDYRATPFESAAKDVDVVIDLIGGETQKRSFAVMKAGGRLVSTVQPPAQDEAKKRDVSAVFFSMQPSSSGLAQLADLLASSAIKTVVTNRYPLAKAAEAWREQMAGHARGKIVLEVAG